MNKNPNPTDRQLLQLILRAQHLARKDARSDEGYAMMLVAILSILIFSMLGAFMTMTNLNKSSTNAYIDSSNTFYTAESGLNRRANELRQKFIGFTTPSGATPGGAVINPAINVVNCFTQPITSTANPGTANDFECRNFQFNYTKNDSKFQNKSNTNEDFGGSAQISGTSSTVSYIGYTFVADRTVFNPPGSGLVQPSAIPAGQNFAGLNALNFQYTVYASAAKVDPQNPTTTVQGSDARTVLQMNFTSRIVPLFQFAVFYDGDLEMNSSSNLNLAGRVHTNADFYVQPNTTDPTVFTTFANNITAGGKIYNRVDAAGYASGATFPPPGFSYINGSVRLATGGTPAFETFPNLVTTANSGTGVGPIDVSLQSATFRSRVQDGGAGVSQLTVPSAGFLRKRNYYQSSLGSATAVGEYWSKADMRLEMVPDRDAVTVAGGTTNLTGAQITANINTGTPWARNERIIPFNFTSIQTVNGGACSTTAPAINQEPLVNYIDPNRNNVAALRCNIFTKGQLQSLRQPVLVLTDINNPALITQERDTLRAPGTVAGPNGVPAAVPAFPAASVMTMLPNYGAANATAPQILRALQVALASTSRPIPLDALNVPLNNAAYAAGTPAGDFKLEFQRLINLPAIGLATNALDTWSPSQIAALRNAWFLPAPIQRLTSNFDTTTPRVGIVPTSGTDPATGFTVITPASATAAANYRSSGFYDGRERRWITMLQTNIKSLAVWNRDGLFVNPIDPDLRTPYAANNAAKDAAFNNGTGANFTNNQAFVRQTNLAGFAIAPATGSLQALGLGSSDTTEGGLVFHSTVSDDLNGDGVSDVTSTVPIYQLNSDGTRAVVNGSNVILDYVRRYWGQAGYRQSPFGFAFNGGDFLPGALTLVTDQAIYTQGDFNNNNQPQTTTVAGGIVAPNANRLPAAIIGDTITILSNQCITNSSALTATNDLSVLAGQISCGLPRTVTGVTNNVPSGATFYNVTSPTAVNAAFLSYTDQSNGNCKPISGGYSCTPVGGLPGRFSGALNNYIRMLENWAPTVNRQFFNYSGSFVSLGSPVEYSGSYVSGGGNYYNIPNRNFNFDPNFNAFSNLPPLSPRAIYLQQDVFKRTY
jgi:hypothetical protein